MRVCLGGTFHPFHIGHQALLRRAFEADAVFVGVTDGALSARPDRKVPPWEARREAIEAFAIEVGFAGELVIEALSDPVGPAASQDFDAIVVSPETVQGAKQINRERKDAGLEPLAIWKVAHVLAEDLLTVSSTRIQQGDIDGNGQRLRPLRISVGSANPVKVEACMAEVAALTGCEVEVQGHGVASGVPEQPRGDDTMIGATRRAAAAKESWAEADYAIGVEAGIQHMHGDYDMQACVVQDRFGNETRGWGPGFMYPDWVTKRALEGEMISDILGPVANDPRIGGTTGAIGFLSDGRMDRTALTRLAVRMAFIPRLRPHLY